MLSLLVVQQRQHVEQQHCAVHQDHSPDQIADLQQRRRRFLTLETDLLLVDHKEPVLLHHLVCVDQPTMNLMEVLKTLVN